MKTLYINGKYLSQAVTGVQRYAAGVVEAWDRLLEGGEIDPSAYRFRLLVPKTPRPLPRFRRIEIVQCGWGSRAWEQIELPLRSAGNVLFSPYGAAPLWKGRHVVTIHDAGAAATPQQYSFLFRQYYSFAYGQLGKSCDAMFTVSEFSRRELHRCFAIPLSKISVVAPGCDHLTKVQPAPSILDRAGLSRRKFLLGVSSQSPIKNFEGLVKAWKFLGRTDLRLAIAGKENSRLFQGSGLGEDPAVVRLGYVSDPELRALYENAAVFVYPSYYEGFGIPPVEAMTCGCPVVVASGSSLPEACGDAALYCDPSNPEDIAAKIASVLDSAKLAEELRTKGRRHSLQFTTRSTAMQLWTEIERLL